jgi:DNA-binding transcriptional MerR regulator
MDGRDANGRTYLSIREVLELLVDEFPDVTISKIRFLESRGLIRPERTPSGYRKFYDADVERLRWILRQQRENFLPLKVIKGRLEQGVGEMNSSGAHTATATLFEEPSSAIDEIESALIGAFALEVGRERLGQNDRQSLPPVNGKGDPEPAPAQKRVSATSKVDPPSAPVESPAAPAVDAATSSEDTPVAPENSAPSEAPNVARRASALSAASFSPTELAGAAGADPALIADLESFGLVSSREIAGERCYDEEALAIARLAAGFARFGIEARHLRAFKLAAQKDAALYAQVVVPLLRQHNAGARERALTELEELGRLGAALHASLLDAELRDLTGG